MSLTVIWLLSLLNIVVVDFVVFVGDFVVIDVFIIICIYINRCYGVVVVVVLDAASTCN